MSKPSAAQTGNFIANRPYARSDIRLYKYIDILSMVVNERVFDDIR